MITVVSRQNLCVAMPEPDDLNPYAPPDSLDDVSADDDAWTEEDLSVDLQHVFIAIQYLVIEKQRNDEDEVHLDATEICSMVLSLACRMTAYDPDGEEALEYLAEMNLRTSEAVGRAVEQLDALGLTRPDEDDKPSDFDGLYDLSTSVEEWLLPFDLKAEMEFACVTDGMDDSD